MLKKSVRQVDILGALAVVLILIGASACATIPPAPAATPTSLPPTATAVPQAIAPIPLYQTVTLTSVPFEEHGQPFSYKVTTETPTLSGSDPRLRAFDVEAAAVVKAAIDDFKQKLAAVTGTPVSAASYLDVRYDLLSPPGNIFSLKFQMEGYVTGAAHPYHVSQTLNYDLEQGRDISLADLFVPDSDYLVTIADYCTNQLNSRDIGFQGFELGAAPMPGNYRNWNITSEGLMITFDEYQVAPYASGPPTVLVPYAEIKSLIDPQGELGTLIK